MLTFCLSVYMGLHYNLGFENFNFFILYFMYVFIPFVLLTNLCLLKLPTSVAEICLCNSIYVKCVFSEINLKT